MSNASIAGEVRRRRTFAIISHPDAGKTTVTEKLLLFSGAIQAAGTVKGRKGGRHATSDWMEIEKQRGISVTSSVMQFVYRDCVFNLLDTPGHEDFSEDTYRTLTAVDAALMVIDAARGVEARTVKLMEVCRLRDTPIITFINKLDRESRDPLDLLDEIERVLDMPCAPVTWPIGSGQRFRGIYQLGADRVRLFRSRADKDTAGELIEGLDNPVLAAALGGELEPLREGVSLIEGAGFGFDREAFLAGRQTPVYFGSALNSFGVGELLDGFVEHAPPPLPRDAGARRVSADEPRFSGFVFKIQANMDPAHRDRIAFLRICSGAFREGMKLHHVRLERDVNISGALSFMARERGQTELAWSGDILGLHSHGSIQIGDTFTEGEKLKFSGIPYFAPEIFRRVVLKDPLRAKALHKGLDQLSEEGATQVFRPVAGNQIILGAVGALQFDVTAWRLRNEYGVECVFEPAGIQLARWVRCDDARELERLQAKAHDNLALDAGQNLTYLAGSRVNLQLAMERFPGVEFLSTREH